MKNNKKLFLVFALLSLLFVLSVVGAVDDGIATGSDTSGVSSAGSDLSSVSEVQNMATDDGVAVTRKVEKDDKNIKASTNCVEVNNSNQLINAVNQAVNDSEHDEYVICLNEGTYRITTNKVLNSGVSTPNIIINANGQTLTASKNTYYTRFNNGCNVLINDAILTQRIQNYGNNIVINSSTISNMVVNRPGMNLTITNSLLNSTISNAGNLVICDDCQVTGSFGVSGAGQIFTNNTVVIEALKAKNKYLGENTIENGVIDTELTNYGTLYLRNVTISSAVTNYGVLVVDEYTTFTGGCSFTGSGSVDIDDVTRILPYLTVINGTYTIENTEFSVGRTFDGRITLINCTLTGVSNYNYGVLILRDTNVSTPYSGMTWLMNYGLLVVEDGVEIVNGTLSDQGGDVYYGRAPETINPKHFEGENRVENITFIVKSVNDGDLTLVNCNITAQITNNANLTLINCSLSNNDKSVTGANVNGFLLNNQANASLIGCVMENNTFNTTSNDDNSGRIYGAIVNRGDMSIVNSSFNNNRLGYYYADESYYYYGGSFGNGTICFNDGVLSVDNSNFSSNSAGSNGGSIVNNNKLTITDSYFYNNTAVVRGGAVALEGGEAVITGTIFKENSVTLAVTVNILCGGGAVYAGSGLAGIINCSFENNSASSLVAGIAGVSCEGGSIAIANIKVNITNSTFKNHEVDVIANGKAGYTAYNSNATLENCVFVDNRVGITDYFNMNILNNNFTNTSGGYVIYNNAQTSIYKTIAGNFFTDNNLAGETILTEKGSNFNTARDVIDMTLENNTYTHTSINDSLAYDIPFKVYAGDTIGFTYTVNNPESYDEDILEGVTYEVTIDDTTYNATTNTITLNTSGEHIIKVRPSTSTSIFTKTVDVLPVSDVIITPENFNEYVVGGKLTRVDEDDRVLFKGNFTDKADIYIDTADIIIDGRNAHFTNTTFNLDAQNIVIQNMNIENTNTSYPITNSKKNVHILDNHINLTNTAGPTAAIKNTASNVVIKDNTLYVDGPSLTIDYTVNGIANTQAILLVGANKNNIENNTITVTTTQSSQIYGTIEAITANNVKNTNITANTIHASNAKFTYAVNMLLQVTGNQINQNNITVTGYRYADGIQVGNSAEDIIIDRNNINITCHNTTPVDEEALSYGIITTNMGAGTSTDITITNNNITLDTTIGYGIEIYQTTQTQVINNTINVNGAYSMGIGYAHSPDSTVQGNNITIHADGTTRIAAVTEEIQPENVGIKIQQNSDNIKIDDGWIYGTNIYNPNTIHTNDKAKQDYAVNVDSSQKVDIHGNKLRCSNGYGNQAIKNNTNITTGTNGEGNVADKTYVNLEADMPTETLIDQPVTINITLKDEYDENLELYSYDTIKIQITTPDTTETLTITTNNTTYTYTPTKRGTQDITITFNQQYGPQGTYNTTTTTKILTVHKPELRIDEITANINETTTLTAHIIIATDNITSQININTGQVYFKANGKILRDTQTGKIIYADVTDNTATAEYQVPKSWNEETIIEAVYTGSDEIPTMTSQAINPTITQDETQETEFAVDDVTASAGEQVTITVTTKNLDAGKVVLKVNGKTIKADDGKLYAKTSGDTVTFTYSVPKTYKSGDYAIKAVYTGGATKLEADAKLTVA